MKKLLLNLIFALLLTSLQTLLAQKIFLVDAQKTANTTATGVTIVDAASWNNACGRLQNAINAATANDQIWLRTGTYQPAGGAASFIMKQGVQIYGHFTGSETELSQRNLTVEANKSTLAGGGTVLQGLNLTTATILDGFTVTTRTGNTSATRGIILTNSSPIIRNCVFVGLSGTSSGAAIINHNSSPLISDCIFQTNICTMAGIVWNVDGSPSFTNCKFLNNTGTAIYNDNATITLTNCTFDRNHEQSGAYGGAIYSTYGSTSNISGCTFTNNRNPGGSGGAIHDYESTSNIENSTFIGNISGRGGAIAHYGTGTPFTLDRCIIRNNSASEIGGGIESGGNLIARNCFISENTSQSGGGAVGGGTFTNCVITKNSVTSTGGGTYFGSFINCVIAGNHAGGEGGGTLRAGIVTNSIIWGNSSVSDPDHADNLIDPYAISNSFIGKGYSGGGSSNADPMFINIDNPMGADNIFGTADDGLRLKNCSPAIDAGTNTGTTEVYDISGATRVFNNTVDAGAYESQGISEIPVITASGPLMICNGNSLTLTAPEGYGDSYLWSPGGGTGPTIAVTTAGNYSVSITTVAGCTTISAPVAVTVTDSPSPPIITAGGPTEFCADGSVVLSNTSAWTARATPGGPTRANAVAFAIGNKGYMGTGLNSSGENLKDFWEYDPETDVWSQKADFAGSARSVATGFAIGNYGYIGTGFDGGHTKDFYQYDPQNNSWTRKADFGGTSRYKATGFSIGVKGYITLGYMPTGYSTELWEYEPTSDSWTSKKPFPGIAREAAVAFSIGNSGYVGTGFAGGDSYKDFYKYDAATDDWERKADFGGSARQYAAGFSIGGSGYVGTGSNTNDFWAYNPTSDSWTEKSAVPGSGKNAAIGFVINGKGYLGAGSGANEFYEFDGETSYTWSTGANTPTITVNTSGSYTLTASKQSGCSITSAPIVVSVDPIALSPSLIVTQPTCAVPTGSVTIETDEHTTSEYTYAIGNGDFETQNTFGSLSSGNYTIHVKSAGGCISSADFTINEQPLTPDVPAITVSGPTTLCEGRSVTLSAPAGYPSYLWTTGQTTSSIVVSEAGSYAVTVSNAAGCNATSAPIAVTVYGMPTADVLQITQPSCVTATGSVTVDAGNTVATGYSYALNEGAYQNACDFQNLVSGDYILHIRNSNDCVISVNITIQAQPTSAAVPAVVASGPTNFCEGGSVTLSAPAGYISYAWSNGQSTTSSLVVSEGGSYTVTVTDEQFCTAVSVAIQVTETSPIVPVLTISQPTCSESTGTITVETDENTPAGYTYAIGTGAYQSGNLFTNLDPGTYTVFAKTADACIASAIATLTPAAITITGSGPANFCAGGGVTLSVPAGYASYLWSTNESSSSITVSASGDYTVTATDASGCSLTSRPYLARAIPTVLYVDQSITVSGDGGTWNTAYKELSDAVAAAQIFNCISEIHVAAGTYKPTNDGNRDSTFAIYRGGLKIYGGYASGGGARNVAVNTTTLSGDIGTSGDADDNSYHVMLIVGIPAASDSLVIDGFSIQQGNASEEFDLVLRNGVETFPINGGAIFAAGNAADLGFMLRNCKFTDNTAGRWGGGIYLTESPLTVRECVFRNNISQTGGALSATLSNLLTVSDSDFMSNTSASGGAVVSIYTPSAFTNCTFAANTSSSIGGAVYAAGAPVTFSGCLLTGNTSATGGALVYLTGKLTITNSTFNASHATNRGGTMVLQEATGSIDNSIIWGSTSPVNPVFLTAGATPVIRNSIVQDITNSNNNLNTDPLFSNAINPAGSDGIFGTADDGLRLQPCSPAINGGDDTFIPAEFLTDLSGETRRFGSSVDIGAYELQSSNVAEVLLAANNDVSTKIIPSLGTVTYKVDGSDCKDVAVVQSTGTQPVSGSITAKIWVDATQPAHFVKRHFEITPADNAATATARVTLFATDSEFAEFNSQSPAPANLLPLSTDDAATKAARIVNIQIEKRSGTSNDGTGQPTTYNGTSTTITPNVNDIVWNSAAARWEITFAVTGFSGFFIKTQSTPLPVHWVSVTAALNIENQPVISWKVEETSVTSYSIQKSTDARQFESIGEVEAMGDGSHQYTFTDKNELAGTVYYRISQTDLDGTITFSRMVKLDNKANFPAPAVYPIPAKNEVFVVVKSQKTGVDYKVTLTDLNGRNLKTQSLEPGNNKIAIEDLSTGIYLLRTSRGEVFKIIKE